MEAQMANGGFMRQVYTHCTVDGCGLLHKARGLCNAHYAQLKRGVNPNQPIKRRDMNPPDQCTVTDCGHPVVAKGLCQMHYVRKQRHGFVKNPDRTKPFKTCWYTGCDSRAICSGLCNLHYTHGRNLRNTYGISMQDYVDMLALQGGVCAVCSRSERAKDSRSGKLKMMAVDHDHDTGKVRGILCSHCNRAIGLFNDDSDMLHKAANYLTHHRSTVAGNPSTPSQPKSTPEGADAARDTGTTQCVQISPAQ